MKRRWLRYDKEENQYLKTAIQDHGNGKTDTAVTNYVHDDFCLRFGRKVSKHALASKVWRLRHPEYRVKPRLVPLKKEADNGVIIQIRGKTFHSIKEVAVLHDALGSFLNSL